MKFYDIKTALTYLYLANKCLFNIQQFSKLRLRYTLFLTLTTQAGYYLVI